METRHGMAAACLGLLMGGWAFGYQQELARELPRVPATEPDRARETFRIQEGFRLLVAATEPEVTDPVAAAFDADGRLYVVEMRGYPYADDVPPGSVRLLEDRDGDGRFDTSSLFLDNLSWPTSVVPYDGGVFVAAAPEILYAKDTNGDGRADVRRVMFRGFGTQNVQALVNGLLWGPDGWIHGASGGNGGEIRNLSRPDQPSVSVRGMDFRFRPDGSAFEVISGGGQFGHTFDDWGHRFVCSNSNHIRQVVLPAREMARNPDLVPPAPVVDIAREGGAAPVFRISPPEPWRIVRTRQRAADPAFVKRAPASELVPIGFFTSATGVTIYRGSAFPESYRGNAFIGDVGGNLVHRKRIEPSGPIFQARRTDEGVEFLASTDTWFRPVNFVNTPSGTLLVLDMYRETIEHPASIPDPIKRYLDLTSGHDRGRLYEIVPDSFRRRPAPRLGRASTAELVPTLADPDAWWRETAQRLLIERNDPSALPLLRELVRSRPTAQARWHALGTLEALGRLEPEDLRTAFDDPEPAVRERVARLSGRLAAANEAIRSRLIAMAQDPIPMVRFEAALALGDVPQPEALAALARIASGSPPDDRWTRAAVLSGLRGRVLDFLETTERQSPDFLKSAAGRVWLGELVDLVAGGRDREAMRDLIVRFTRDTADPASTRVVLLGVARGLRRQGLAFDSVVGADVSSRLEPLYQRLAAQAQDDGGDLDQRVQAIELLTLAAADRVLDSLIPLLDARRPPRIQLAAVQALNGLRDARVGSAVAARWKALGPTARREAAELLFARPDRRTALVEAIEAGAVTAGDLDPARRRQLLDDPESAIRQRARALLGGEPSGDLAERIQSYSRSLELDGDRARGRQVYTKACATCHRAESAGVAVGPDLVTVADRSPSDLLIHILDPNREIAPTYVNYTIATSDGRVVSGMLADESATALTLKRAEGVTEVVPRSQIEEITTTGQSLMPEGLEKEMRPEDLADLLAFIRGLKGSAGGSSR